MKPKPSLARRLCLHWGAACFFSLVLPADQSLTQTVFPADGELVVRILAGSAVVVTGHDGHEIAISARTPEALASADWSWLIRDEQAVFTLEKRIDSGLVEFSVPKGVRLVIESHGGSVGLAGLTGTVAGQIGCGNLGLCRLSGVVDLVTGNGDVSVETCTAIGQVLTRDGQAWCRDVAPDLVVRTGFGGALVLVGALGQPSGLATEGTDLFLAAQPGKERLLIRLEDGFLRIPETPVPVSVEIKNGGIDIPLAGKEIDLLLVNGRGRLTVDGRIRGPMTWRLKCVDAWLSMVDQGGLIGGIMFALQDMREGWWGNFIALPFANMKEMKKSSTLQVRRVSGGSNIQVELRSASMILPTMGTRVDDRRIQ
jgi:hypothetical protein